MLDLRLDRRALLGGAAALTALPAWARTPVRQDNRNWDKLQAWLDAFVTKTGLPGLAASVARGTDDATFLNTGTIADGSTRAIDADTLFRIYSMTKPVTGIAAMMLIEDGKLGLDQDIGELIPSFRNPRVLVDPARDLTSRAASGPVTVRHLLTHTAGLGYNIVTKGPLLDAYLKEGIVAGQLSKRPIPGFPPVTPAPTLVALADRVGALPLIADPGTRWSYSVSLDVLGRVIEVASGVAFDAFLKTRLFDPLGMTSTGFTVAAADVARLTTNYGVSPLGKLPIDPGADSIFAAPPPFPSGGAGLVSSARDYDRFLAMLAGQGALGRTRVMKAETVKLAMSNLMPAGIDTKGTLIEGHGFGAGGRVALRNDMNGRGVGTFGWAGAAATIGWVDPVTGIRAAGYSQHMPDGAYGFHQVFARAVYDAL